MAHRAAAGAPNGTAAMPCWARLMITRPRAENLSVGLACFCEFIDYDGRPDIHAASNHECVHACRMGRACSSLTDCNGQSRARATRNPSAVLHLALYSDSSCQMVSSHFPT
eukprot:1158966-Pelagomonas_calceolata.AAC.5